MLLAAMDVEHLGFGEPPHETPHVDGVGHRREAAGQRERLDVAHPRVLRAPDHPRLAAPLAHEPRLVPGALELHRDASGPVRVRRPTPAGHDLENGHLVCEGPVSVSARLASRLRLAKRAPALPPSAVIRFTTPR